MRARGRNNSAGKGRAVGRSEVDVLITLRWRQSLTVIKGQRTCQRKHAFNKRDGCHTGHVKALFSIKIDIQIWAAQAVYELFNDF